ncbi:hypothetical protein FLACOL7796_04691 [Flavobacterium collinsii]|uniref:Uncharacterized protein n=1 Tax=Flavobacterium collinsii TaxID=1114861 RepID=A0ABN7ERZ6_9FLAO|nr:hypothetical protein FLACOL7796_04691 [Flavobacterium collinsii]
MQVQALIIIFGVMTMICIKQMIIQTLDLEDKSEGGIFLQIKSESIWNWEAEVL